MVAPFDRAAARDFVDVYTLNPTFTKTVLLDRAAEVDAGFELTVFAEILDHLVRHADADLDPTWVGSTSPLSESSSNNGLPNSAPSSHDQMPFGTRRDAILVPNLGAQRACNTRAEAHHR